MRGRSGKREHAKSTGGSAGTFQHAVGDVILVHWSDERIYYAKIKTINENRQTCQVIFENNRRGTADFDQIHAVDSKVEQGDWIACIVCKFGTSDPPNQIVLCDDCGIAYHQKCHCPVIPDSALKLSEPWSCYFCQKEETNPHLNPTYDYTPFGDKTPFGKRRLATFGASGNASQQGLAGEGKGETSDMQGKEDGEQHVDEEDQNLEGRERLEILSDDASRPMTRLRTRSFSHVLSIRKRRQFEQDSNESQRSLHQPMKKSVEGLPSPSSTRKGSRRENAEKLALQPVVIDSQKVAGDAEWKRLFRDSRATPSQSSMITEKQISTRQRHPEGSNDRKNIIQSPFTDRQKAVDYSKSNSTSKDGRSSSPRSQRKGQAELAPAPPPTRQAPSETYNTQKPIVQPTVMIKSQNMGSYTQFTDTDSEESQTQSSFPRKPTESSVELTPSPSSTEQAPSDLESNAQKPIVQSTVIDSDKVTAYAKFTDSASTGYPSSSLQKPSGRPVEPTTVPSSAKQTPSGNDIVEKRRAQSPVVDSQTVAAYAIWRKDILKTAQNDQAKMNEQKDSKEAKLSGQAREPAIATQHPPTSACSDPTLNKEASAWASGPTRSTQQAPVLACKDPKLSKVSAQPLVSHGPTATQPQPLLISTSTTSCEQQPLRIMQRPSAVDVGHQAQAEKQVKWRGIPSKPQQPLAKSSQSVASAGIGALQPGSERQNIMAPLNCTNQNDIFRSVEVRVSPTEATTSHLAIPLFTRFGRLLASSSEEFDRHYRSLTKGLPQAHTCAVAANNTKLKVVGSSSRADVAPVGNLQYAATSRMNSQEAGRSTSPSSSGQSQDVGRLTIGVLQPGSERQLTIVNRENQEDILKSVETSGAPVSPLACTLFTNLSQSLASSSEEFDRHYRCLMKALSQAYACAVAAKNTEIKEVQSSTGADLDLVGILPYAATSGADSQEAGQAISSSFSEQLKSEGANQAYTGDSATHNVAGSHQATSADNTHEGSVMFKCVGCGKHAEFVCARCQNVWYCSKECQKRVYMSYCRGCVSFD